MSFRAAALVMTTLSMCDPGGDEPPAGPSDGTEAYFQARRDFRRCVYPLCGGYWVARLNHADTVCVDGTVQPECYVPELDLPAGLSPSQIDEVNAHLEEVFLVLRGGLFDEEHEGYGNMGRFVSAEVWTPVAPGTGTGVFERVTDNGTRCVAAPCLSMDAERVNHGVVETIADLDFQASEASSEEIQDAWDETFSSSGLLIRGESTTVTGPAGTVAGSSVSQFYIRM